MWKGGDLVMGSLTSKSSATIKNRGVTPNVIVYHIPCVCACVCVSVKISLYVNRSANLSCQLMEPVLQMECCLKLSLSLPLAC